MTTATLTNSFHNTSVEIDAKWTEMASNMQMPVLDVLHHEAFDNGNQEAKRVYNRVRKALCGIDGCTCGGVR